jgi:hypothetical protein
MVTADEPVTRELPQTIRSIYETGRFLKFQDDRSRVILWKRNQRNKGEKENDSIKAFNKTRNCSVKMIVFYLLHFYKNTTLAICGISRNKSQRK